MSRTLKLVMKEAEVTEYRYITNHGVGPGTVPDGVFIRSEDLDSGKTAIYLNRPLSDEELNKYDIKPEWIQEDKALSEDLDNDYNTTASVIANIINTKYADGANKEQIMTEIKDWLSKNQVKEPLASDKLYEIITKKVKLTEAEDDSVDEVVDDIQDETPVEDEDDSVDLDAQLQELRDILPDLDLHLYQVTDKEDTNKSFYFIGKVAEDSDDVLMLVDNKPVEDDEEELPVLGEAEELDIPEDNENEPEEENRFDFIVIPSKYEDFIKMNPRYGDELTPDHEGIMEYLMQCLIEKNPDRAEEINSDNAEEEGGLDND